MFFFIWSKFKKLDVFENILFKILCGHGLKIVVIEHLGRYTTGSAAGVS
jgi:hypothetical protein